MKWLASIRYNDDPFEDELFLGAEGTSDGFLLVDDEGNYPSNEPGYTLDEVRDLIQYHYGCYDTLTWL